MLLEELTIKGLNDLGSIQGILISQPNQKTLIQSNQLTSNTHFSEEIVKVVKQHGNWKESSLF